MLLSPKKSKIYPFATTWMDLEGIMVSERQRQISYDSTYMWDLNKINEQAKQKQTHRYREQIDDSQMGEDFGEKGIQK